MNNFKFIFKRVYLISLLFIYDFLMCKNDNKLFPELKKLVDNS